MRRLLALTLLAVLALAATAFAVLPRRSAHYRGQSSQHHTVTFRVSKDGKYITALDFGPHTNPCGPDASSLKRPGKIRIHHDGSFDDVLNRNAVHDIEEEGIAVKGHFQTHGRATGRTRYEDRGCTDDPGVTWTARVVRP